MPTRRTDRLHEYRWSAQGTRYFVTCCTAGRRAGLYEPAIRRCILDEIAASDRQEDTRTLAFVLMPEHVHWLLALGSRLQLGRVIARLKAHTRDLLAGAGLVWQRDYFEHRLRSEDSTEDYARYVFLNPYRAGLIDAHSSWKGWWCPAPELFRFTALLNVHGGPPAEWITESVPQTLVQAD